MSGAAPREAVEAATAYERLHVPALFAQWAPVLADAAAIAPGERVLDVACGTGVLAREAVARVGDAGSVAGVDPNPGMLAVARELGPEIAWREAVADALPFDDGAFDVVACQFGLMFFPDRPAALHECARVLAPGGRLAVAVWDSLENSEAYPIEVALLERLAGKEAAEALRAPFVLGDHLALRELLEEAGLESVEVVTRHGTARFPDLRTMVEADLRGWLPVMGVELDEDTVARILSEAERELARYVTPEGTMVFDSPALLATGRKAGSGRTAA